MVAAALLVVFGAGVSAALWVAERVRLARLFGAVVSLLSVGLALLVVLGMLLGD